MMASSLSRWTEHASTSSLLGLLFLGGLHITTLEMKTSPRDNPALARILSSSFPAEPTKGRPDSSSLRPGASPTKTTWELRSPSPRTLFFTDLQRPHSEHASTWDLSFSTSRLFES